MDIPPLKKLRINGDISIEPVNGEVPDTSYRYLIIGPTGAGKSSFIEAIAGEAHSLSLSNNQLAGYTQKVTAYAVVNTEITVNYPVYLIDTPGFLDTKISEIEVINMIRSWLKENDLVYVDYILFLLPVNGTRLSGTIRRTVALVKEFLSSPQSDHGSIVFVTTMWDTLFNERVKKRAEDNLKQMERETFNDYVELGAKIARFMNTRTSALEILDLPNYNGFIFQGNTRIISSPHLYENLFQRIEVAVQARTNLESDLAQEEVLKNEQLKTLLERNYEENEAVLIKIIAQFDAFGPPPEGYEDAHRHLKTVIASVTQQNQQMQPFPADIQPPIQDIRLNPEAKASEEEHGPRNVELNTTYPLMCARRL